MDFQDFYKLVNKVFSSFFFSDRNALLAQLSDKGSQDVEQLRKDSGSHERRLALTSRKVTKPLSHLLYLKRSFRTTALSSETEEMFSA